MNSSEKSRYWKAIKTLVSPTNGMAIHAGDIVVGLPTGFTGKNGFHIPVNTVDTDEYFIEVSVEDAEAELISPSIPDTQTIETEISQESNNIQRDRQ